MAVRVTALVCPECGGALAGLRFDRVFFCPACRRALEPGDGRWTPHPILPAAAPPKEAVHFYLPLWRFRVTVTAAPVNRRQEAACRTLDDFTVVWVNAFNMLRPSYYGDLGLAYTEKGVEPKPTEDFAEGCFVAGCARGREDAARYTQLYATYILDKRSDVTGMTINVDIINAALWAIPFAEVGDKVIDLVSGTELPVFALDDLEDLKRANKQ